jgi:hypothetical protein
MDKTATITDQPGANCAWCGHYAAPGSSSETRCGEICHDQDCLAAHVQECEVCRDMDETAFDPPAEDNHLEADYEDRVSGGFEG